MKRLLGYLACLIGLCAVFTLCYYVSFRNALREFNEHAIERDSQILSSFDEYKKQLSILSAQQNAGTKNESSVPVQVVEEVISPQTKYVLETYHVTTNQLSRVENHPTSELVGLNRNQVITLLSNYMTNIPISEKNKGLFAYELLSFSAKEIVIRKSYNEDLVAFRYFVAIKEGKVVVYYSDLKTIKDETGIDAMSLLETDRNELMQGIYVKDEEELFSLLEGYSS